MSDDFFNIALGILIGLIISYYITLFGIAYKMSKECTKVETERTVIYTYSWEVLKDE